MFCRFIGFVSLVSIIGPKSLWMGANLASNKRSDKRIFFFFLLFLPLSKAAFIKCYFNDKIFSQKANEVYLLM